MIVHAQYLHIVHVSFFWVCGLRDIGVGGGGVINAWFGCDASNLQFCLETVIKKYNMLQENFIKTKAAKACASTISKETRKQVTSTWQLKLNQREQELQSRIVKEAVPNEEMIEDQKNKIEEYKKILEAVKTIS